MKGEHGRNKWWGGAISMLEIASTQGLLDHDTSQAVLIIWTAPSAPLIFYPHQFIRSSVCTHTAHFTKKALSSVPVWRGASAWLAVMIQRQRDRMKDRGKAVQLEQRGDLPRKGCESMSVGGWGGDMCRAARLLSRVPLLCLIESMSPLKAV